MPGYIESPRLLMVLIILALSIGRDTLLTSCWALVRIYDLQVTNMS